MNPKKIKLDLVEACAYLSRLGFVVADHGFASARADQTVFLTPHGVHRRRLDPRSFDTVRLDGKSKDKHGISTNSEAWTHLVIYRELEDVGAVVSAHPPTATGFSCSGESVDLRLLPELLGRLGGVPLLRRDAERAGGESGSVVEHLRESKALLIANRGVVTVGADIWDAVARLELVEHCARVHQSAKVLGKVEPPPDDHVARVVEVHFEAEGGRNL